MSSSKPLRYRSVFPHLEHLLYSLKLNSSYVLKENDSLWAQNALYKACKIIFISNRTRWFFTISPNKKINMPSVRFELTTARSSASLLTCQVECSPRLSYDGTCLTYLDNSYIILSHWMLPHLSFVEDKFRYYLLVIWFLEL